MRDNRQWGSRRMGHGGFGIQEAIGGQHHGLDFELCGE